MHTHDANWGKARVPYCDKRDGWALPGNGFTRIESVAMATAKKISKIIEDGDVQFVRREGGQK
jgi:hypothetical protein